MVCMTVGKPLDKRHRVLGEAAKSRCSATTDSELSELEDKVAMAVAKVHNTESEVSDIENKIAALSAAGMSVEKSKKKASGTHQRKKASHDYPLSQADLFVRNSLYRGSLTQRNPVAKDKRKAPYAGTHVQGFSGSSSSTCQLYTVCVVFLRAH
ncbi:hypothetical protein AAFF_G00194950 [Aldrovandia affinis]|uniref:Rab effector MyRIP/Melanophilin domain-containing protein n=1 Tax=Aldrovandia affinis TaxID=143900 RepID=A0AAD7WV25_9TELE|nr:hypothetical protein AAFF_G00194950 [Aldrovandia affinis]